MPGLYENISIIAWNMLLVKKCTNLKRDLISSSISLSFVFKTIQASESVRETQKRYD